MELIVKIYAATEIVRFDKSFRKNYYEEKNRVSQNFFKNVYKKYWPFEVCHFGQNDKLQTVNTSFILVLYTSHWYQSIGNVPKISKMYTYPNGYLIFSCQKWILKNVYNKLISGPNKQS